jgi:hypothetical protein
MRTVHVAFLLPFLGAFGCAPNYAIPGCRVAGENFDETCAHFGTVRDELVIVVWSDIDSRARSVSTSSSAIASDHSVELAGSREGLNGPSMKWKLTTGDGKAGAVTINGQTFRLEYGGIFLVRTKAEPAHVLQVKHDISAMKPGADTWKLLGEANAQVKEFLAQSNDKK